MGISVASGTKLARGSGRTFHLMYPQIGVSRVLNNAPNTNGSFRQGPTIAGIVSIGAAGTGTTVVVAAATQNAAPIEMRCPLAADKSFMKFTQHFYPILDQLGNDTQPDNPQWVYRFLVLAAFPLMGGALPGAADNGLLILAQNQTTMEGIRAGVSFGPTSNTQIGLRVRRVNGGGLTVDRNLTFAQAAVNDVTKFNLWELRLSNADSHGGAQLKGFINGRQFGAPIDCGSAAAIFPAIDVGGGGFVGFSFCFNNVSPGAAYSNFFNEQHMIIAQTEDDSD